MLSKSDVEDHIDLFDMYTRPLGPVLLRAQLNY